jgi:hypothetical protein
MRWKVPYNIHPFFTHQEMEAIRNVAIAGVSRVDHGTWFEFKR